MSLMKLFKSLWKTLDEKELAIALKTEVNMLVLGMHTLLKRRVLSYPSLSEEVGTPVGEIVPEGL